MLEPYGETVAAATNIPELFLQYCYQYASRPAYSYPQHQENEILWKIRTSSQVKERVFRIAAFLRSRNVMYGDKVAIICGTRPEWMECDIAILLLGAVCVSVYPSLPASDVGFILNDSGAQHVIAENIEQVEKIIELERLGTFSYKTLLTIELTEGGRDTFNLDTVFSERAYDPSRQEEDFLIAQEKINRDTISSIVYTSGTTGAPKGVVQTHGNHLANVEQAIDSKMFALNGDLFLYLPLAHSFARLIAYLGFLTPAFLKFCGIASTTSSKVDLLRVTRELVQADANVLPTVPRLFEKIQSILEGRATKKTISGWILKQTLSAAQKYFQAHQSKTAPSLLTVVVHNATSTVRSKIKHQLFGANFQYAISGGAKLPRSVAEFFWSLELPIYEGYGLTETCVATNVNRQENYRIGSVGPALKDVRTKIADDGEILFDGPNITKTYYNRPEETAASWDAEGWFHTGDIGHVDEDGFLFITDRKKDLVVTAGGKKIPPQKIENILTSFPLIEQAVYAGDGKPYCVALLTLNPSQKQQYKSEQELDQALQNIKAKVNGQLSSFEAVKKFAILDQELTVDNGYLTPTLKVKRKLVLKDFAADFEGLYKQ